MYEHSRLIALRLVRTSDHGAILSAWSSEHGHVSLSVTVGQGRPAARRRAILQPLSLFEGEIDIRPGRDIHTIRDIAPAVPAMVNITGANPLKTLVAMFCADSLDAILRETATPDAALSQLLIGAIYFLENTTHPTTVANFPICLLLSVARIIGIMPDDGDYRPGYWFSMQDGRFTATMPVNDRHALSPDDAAQLHTLMRMRMHNCHLFALTRARRNRVLDDILHYYTLHYAPLNTLSSLPILRSVND